MAKIIALDKVRQSTYPRKPRSKSGRKRFWKNHKSIKWSSFTTSPLSMPLATEMMREQYVALPAHEPAVLETGVLAFRHDDHGDPVVLLISRKRSKKWGIPKGKAAPTRSFPENAAKEAFEEAGVLGYVSPISVGVFHAQKHTADPQTRQIIEVWVYLLEVSESVTDWPEKGKREIRWVPCEVAARQLRQPLLSRLCRQLAGKGRRISA